jgi:uncharacterized delta-60 repeat protein
MDLLQVIRTRVEEAHTPSVTGVTIETADQVITAGYTRRLTAIVEPADAGDTTVTWVSGDESVATVDAGGVVTAEAPGTTTITVTTPDGLYSDTCNILVIAAGELDPSFDEDGLRTHHGAAGGMGNDRGNDIVVDAGGNIRVAGTSESQEDDDMALWCFADDGSFYSGFASNGYTTAHDAAGGNGIDRGYAGKIGPGGDIFVVGTSETPVGDGDMVLWRYNNDGSPVWTKTHHSAAGGNGNDWGYAITKDADGTILITGFSMNASGNADMALWRFNHDGSLDTSFNGQGYVVHDDASGESSDDSGDGITIGPGGKILVAGESEGVMVVWRYNEDGSLDTTFGEGGYVTYDGAADGNGDYRGEAITVDPYGRILVAGDSYNGSDYDMAVWRFK